MSFSSTFLIPLYAAGTFASAAVAQTSQPASKPQLTARELFYSASPEQEPTHRDANHHVKPKAKDGSKSDPKGGGSPKGSKGSTPPGGVTLPGGGQIINVAEAPLGVTYTLKRRVGDKGNNMEYVAPDTVFHTGDRIRFEVRTNYPGYLYIGHRGSSGAPWKPMFPSSEIQNGSNYIEAFHAYAMPPGYRFSFDEKTGVEDVFILFSRESVPDFENLLYVLPAGSTPAAKPVDGKAPPKPLNVASVDLPDSTVARLRSAYSRDLLIEKIDEDEPGDLKAKAVFIVNPPGKSDSRLWYDFQLVHK